MVARRLLVQGAAVHACDTHVVETHLNGGVERVTLTPEEVRSADLVVLLTDHDDFDYEMVVQEAGEILDVRHRVQGPNVEYL
jgi:UDP-N-acetyl-D-glucosamine dehydrogenase